MPELEPILKTAILNLRSGRLDREEDVKLAAILPILNALDWNSADPGALRPEYRVNSGRGARFRQWATRTLRDTEVRARGGSGAPMRLPADHPSRDSRASASLP